MHRAYFITSSGTEIGKTFVTAALIAQLKAAGRNVGACKPLLSGFDEGQVALTDTGILLSALGRAQTQDNIDAMTPWRFGAALSPDMAAAREGRSIEFDEVVSFTERMIATPKDVTLIEGVGGVMAPIGEHHTVLDWIAAVRIPALLVVGGYLGTISHTLSSAKALQSKSVPLVGVVISARGELPVPARETATALARFLPDVPIAILPDCGNSPDAWRQAPDLLDPLQIAHSTA